MSTISTVSNAANAAATQEAAVAGAMKALTTTEKEKSWETNVTNQSGFKKLVGLVSYIWNLRATSALDKAHAPTIAEFKKAITHLVDAVEQRPLSDAENIALKSRGVKLSNCEGLQAHTKIVKLELNAGSKLDNFYALFKTRVSQLTIGENHVDYAAYAGAAQKMVEGHAKTKDIKEEDRILLLKQLELTELHNFNGKIILDMCNGYAKQAIGDINSDTLNAKTTLIREYFGQVTQPTVEALLRTAIMKQHTQAGLLEAAAKFTNPSEDGVDEDNLSFTATKARIVADLTAKKDALKAEYEVLCGTKEQIQALRQQFPGGNIQGAGTVHHATTEKDDAEKAVTKAMKDFIALFRTDGTVNDATSEDALLAVDTTAITIPGYAAAQLTLRNAIANRKTKQDALAVLVKRLKEIAKTYDTAGKVTSGKLFEAERLLQDGNLRIFIKEEMNKAARFYTELAEPVTPTNMDLRSTTLKGITGRNPRQILEQTFVDAEEARLREFRFTA